MLLAALAAVKQVFALRRGPVVRVTPPPDADFATAWQHGLAVHRIRSTYAWITMIPRNVQCDPGVRGRGHNAHAAQADDLELKGRRALWQKGWPVLPASL